MNMLRLGRRLGLAFAGMAAFGLAQAQDISDSLLEEIIVTATKRAGGVEAQQVPVAITAFSAEQLDALHLRDLYAIGFAAPSVQMEDIGTTRGTANFSIRGLGINSSIASIDPTVGVFLDGMYYGINGGVVLDVFDLESVEILRGPQGLLFGRNVTGGAVVMNTTRPTDEFTMNTRAAYESGDNLYLSAVLRGPLTESIGWKLAGYHNDDGGWHTNLADGNNEFGKAETTMVRGALEFDITDDFNLLLRAEVGESSGDGPAAQNAGCAAIAVPGLCVRQYSLDEFDFGINETGFYDNEWTNLIAEVNWDVGFGDGTITNITAYREYNSSTLGDIDSTPVFIFHARSSTDQDQISNELRYSGSWDKLALTAGVYYFEQSLAYLENRLLPLSGFPPPDGISGGGTQDHTSLGVFAQADFQVSDSVILNLGGRFTREEKDANIASISPVLLVGGVPTPNDCVFPDGCSTYDLIDSRDWDNFTPKVGLQIMPDDTTQFYGFWTKGFRSGGYNLRHTSLQNVNEAFDEEEVTSVELGMKKDFADGRVRANLAVYHNRIDDMQREVNLPDATFGVVQLIKNTADATIKGVDAELTAALTDNLVVKASLGYVDGQYDEVRFDLNGDGLIDEADQALKIPRLAPWSYGGEIIYSRETGWGSFTAQVAGYHRDRSFYTDNNIGKLRAIDMFNARVALGFMDDSLMFSIFGRNLKDEVTIGGDTQLSTIFPGSTFSPLNKGTVYGAEVQFILE
jgi:iron complex outermembrane receptor protein